MSDDPSEVESAASDEIQLGYIDGKPVWQIPVDDVTVFQDTEMSLDYRVFTMPSGALIAFWLKSYVDADNPASLHESFDVSRPEHADYLQCMCDTGRLFVLLMGTDGRSLTFEMTVEKEALGDTLQRCKQYNSELKKLDGPAAVSEYVSMLQESFDRHGDIGQAWQAVSNALRASRGLRPSELYVKVFAMPSGAVLACWLMVDGGDGKPMFVERTFDLTSKEIVESLSGAAAAGEIMVDVEVAQTGEVQSCSVPVDGQQLKDHLQEGLHYVRRLPYVNGKASVQSFLAASQRTRSKHDTLEPAWNELIEVVHGGTVSSLKWWQRIDTAIHYGYFAFVRSLQLISQIPKVGAWIVTLSVPVLAAYPLVLLLKVTGSPDAEFEKKLFMMLIALTTTIWTGYLDQAGIVQIQTPYVPIPIWAVGILLTLGAFFAMFF